MTDIKKKNILPRRKWFFTLWNTEFNFNELYEDYGDVIQFLAGQLEKGEKTGRLHFQGCIHLKDKHRMSYVRRLFNMGKGEKSGKLEPQKGTNKQVLDYVHKIRTSIGKKFIFGEPSKQGKRTDIRQIMKLITDGASELEVFDSFPSQSMYMARGIQKYRELINQEKFSKFRELDIHFLSGPTGCGKTRKAYDIHGYSPYKIFKINCNDLDGFWNGYNGQQVVVFDEFSNQIKITKLLEILDGYPFMVNIKGGFVPAQFTKVYITSNLKKDEIYPNAKPEHKKALDRRINQFYDLYPKKDNNKICIQSIEKGNIKAFSTPLGEFSESPRNLDIFDEEGYSESSIDDNNYIKQNCRLIDKIR